MYFVQHDSLPSLLEYFASKAANPIHLIVVLDLNIFRSREARNNYLFCFMSIIATSPAIINACNESNIFLRTAHCQPSLWRRTSQAEQKILSNERPKSLTPLITAHKNMVSLLKILISLPHVHLNSCSSLSADDCS